MASRGKKRGAAAAGVGGAAAAPAAAAASSGAAAASSSTSTSDWRAEEAEVSERLLQIDIWVDAARKQLEAVIEAPLDEARRDVSFMLNRLPSRVKAMRMEDFLRESGGSGDVQALYAKDRKQQKRVAPNARGAAAAAAALAPAPC